MNDTRQADTEGGGNRRLRLAVLAFILLLGAVAALTLPVQSYLVTALEWTRGATTVREGDLSGIAALAPMLSKAEPGTPAALVWARAPESAKKTLSEFTGGEPGAEVGNAVVEALNAAINGPALFREDVFAGAALSSGTREMMKDAEEGGRQLRLNRRLLAEVWPRHISKGPDGIGLWGSVVAAAVYIPACIFFLPGSALTLAAGFLFGLIAGTIAVSIGSTLGACAAFLIGRHTARDWVAAKVRGNPKFEAIDEAVGREGFKIVLLTRLCPIFPFNLLNYAYGLTRVRFGHYALASWIGMLPGTIMYVYLGAGLRSLTATLTGQVSGGFWQTFAKWAGLVVFVAVVVVITRLARKALREAVPRIEQTEYEATTKEDASPKADTKLMDEFGKLKEPRKQVSPTEETSMMDVFPGRKESEREA